MQRRTKFLILFAYYFGCVIIGILIAVFSTPICLQDVCVAKAGFIVDDMNSAASPCKNLYDFVCGKAPIYFRPHQKKNFTSEIYESVFKMMVRKVTAYAGATRNGGTVSINPTYYESILATFFGMCETVQKSGDRATYEDAKSKLFETTRESGMSLRDFCNPEKFNQSLSVGLYEYHLRTAGFPGRHYYTSEIKRDHLDPDNLALYIGRGVSFIAISPHVIRDRSQDNWVTVMDAFVNEFFPAAEDKDKPRAVLAQVVALWFDIMEMFYTAEDKKVQVEAVRMHEMQKRFPEFDFKGLLTVLGAPEKSKRHVYMLSNSKNYFAKLSTVLSKYNRHVQVLYIFFQTLLDVGPFLTLSTDLSSVLEGALSQQNNICRSVLGDRFGGMIFSLIIEKFQLKRNNPAPVTNTFTLFRRIMEKWIHTSTWMDSTTKKRGLDKLKALRAQVSISEKQFDSVKTPGKRAQYYSGLCLQRSVLTTLLCMNRFLNRKNFGLFVRDITGFDEPDTIPMGDIEYNQQSNSFEVPIYILRFPAYEEAWPDHINYGGLGIEMAEELTSGFDFTGSEYDKFGIKREWWTNKTYENYKKIEFSCSNSLRQIEGKSSKSKNRPIPDPKSMTMNDLVNGTLRKNSWGYLMGVKMAFKAFIEHLNNHTYREPLFPGLEMYSHKVAFFLSHAQMRCLPPLPPGVGKEIRRETKLYFQALTTLKEFKDTFNCPSKFSNRKVAAISKAASNCMLFKNTK